MRDNLLYAYFKNCCVLLCCLVFCQMASGQLAAGFKADVTEGCAPVVVQFTDQSAGNPAKWFWDLGNGSSSIQQNPGTIYFAPGKYLVKLTIMNSSGTDSSVWSDYVVVGSKPAVSFSTDIKEGCVPAQVKFSDMSTTTTGAITSWEWDFGDGNTSTEKAPVNTYNVDGNFSITLKVTNSTGCVNVINFPAYIHVKPSPRADFTSGSPASCSPPVQVSFINSSSGGAVLASNWSFGDGSTSQKDNPQHVYFGAGTYQVMLKVTNEFGCSDTVSKPDIIGTITTDFKVPDTVCEDAPVSFLNTSSPATLSSSWRFGDGTVSAQISPVKTFATPGRYRVQLVNNFGACTDSVTKDILVLPKPEADFSFALPQTGCSLPKAVTFTSVAPLATAYLWNFGDNTTSAEANPAHSYTTFNDFTVSLTVTAANGCSNKVAKLNSVPVFAARIKSFPGLPYEGCSPREQPFSAEVVSPEPVSDYLWNLGDGATSTQKEPVHYYANSGSYDVTLVITTISGCRDSLSLAAAVEINDKPKAGFSAEPTVACGNQPIHFSDSSSANVNNWKWLFGDSAVSTLQNPEYHYIDTGYSSVTLIAGNNKCYDTLTIPQYIFINPPLASFYASFNCDTPFVRKFINNSVQPQTSAWDFGDDSTSTLRNPVHTYAAPGKYIVRLQVSNNNCFDQFRDTIDVIDEKPDFRPAKNTICRNATTSFSVINVDTTNIAKYKWDFGDSTNIYTDTLTSAIHKYTTAGTFSPSLTIVDKTGCSRSVRHPDEITVYSLKAAFTNPASACLGKEVVITDSSQAFINAPITKWTMSYGDNTTVVYNTPFISHSFTIPGNLRIGLTITDSLGCSDSTLKPDAIFVSNPKAAFAVSDTIKCSNSPISFKNNSAGSELFYLWNFGDGAGDTSAAPLHAYVSEGFYNASLAVTDKFGCMDTVTTAGAITIQNAKSDFSISDTALSCPPAQTTFFNKSKNASAVNWDFDDGNFSNLDSPLHYFLTARDYRIKLTSYGFGACADSTTKLLTLKGPAGSILYNNPPFQCAPVKIDFSGTATDNSSFIWDFGDGTTNTSETYAISHTYATPGDYVPKLLLLNSNLNCIVFIFGADTISIAGVDAFIKKYDSIYCDTAGIQFFDSSVIRYDKAAAYTWNFGDGTSSPLANPYHTFTRPGIYPVSLQVKTVAGCQDAAKGRLVKIVRSPAFSVLSKQSVCFNDSAFFSSKPEPDTSNLTWKWDFNNGSESAMPNPPPQLYSSPGSYTVTTEVTNSTGCATTVSSALTIQPLPAVDAGADSAICLGNSVTLTAHGADNYLWQNNPALSCTSCANPVASPKDSLVHFIVTGTSAAGCKANDTVVVTVIQPFTITAVAGDTICTEEIKKLEATGADNYTWYPSTGLDNPAVAMPYASPGTTTVYTVVGHDRKACFTDTATVTLTVYPIPVFNILETSVTIAVGDAVGLHTTSSPDITSYTWTPAAGLSCDKCAEPLAAPKVSTTYTAYAYNDGGCASKDQVIINTFCSNGNVFIPNTFSPNNDGVNDVFFLRGKGIAEIKTLQIFNRLGMPVFQKNGCAANNEQCGWDGTVNGQKAGVDVYIYKTQVVCENGTVFSYSGNLALIR